MPDAADTDGLLYVVTMHRFAVAPLLLFPLVACSSGSGGPAAHPAPTSTSTAAPSPTATSTLSNQVSFDSSEGLHEAVQAYSDAYLTGKSKAAYALLSARCRNRLGFAEFASIVRQAGDLYGSALPIKTYTAHTSGDMARVTYTYDVSAINQEAEPWVLESGQWHEDDC